MAAFDEPKSWIALIVGAIVAALGIIPLLSMWGVIRFNFPEFILNIIPSIAIWLIAGIAFLLFIDSMWEDDRMRVVSILISILLLAAGVLQILGNFGVIGFSLNIPTIIYYILFSVEGFFLLIAAFAMD